MCLCALVMVHGYLIQHTEYVLHHLQVNFNHGVSSLCNDFIKPIAIDCGQPVLSPNVSVIANTSDTTEGDTVTLQCEDGLYPVIPVMIMCSNSGNWSPVSTEFVCTVISGK